MTPKQIRAWRERFDLTQGQAASLIGVTGRNWRQWELAERAMPIPVARLLRVCEKLPAARHILEGMAHNP